MAILPANLRPTLLPPEGWLQNLLQRTGLDPSRKAIPEQPQSGASATGGQHLGQPEVGAGWDRLQYFQAVGGYAAEDAGRRWQQFNGGGRGRSALVIDGKPTTPQAPPPTLKSLFDGAITGHDKLHVAGQVAARFEEMQRGGNRLLRSWLGASLRGLR